MRLGLDLALKARTPPMTASYLAAVLDDLDTFGIFTPSPASCFSDAGTTPCAVDDPVYQFNDSLQSYYWTQATLANRPILRKGDVNQLTYSNDFSNAAWTKTNCSVVSGVIGPNGVTADAWKFVSASGSVGILSRSSFSFVAGTTYLIQVKAKAAELGTFGILGATNTVFGSAGANANAVFDLIAGTATPARTEVTASITAAGNGYYTCSIIFTPTTSASYGPQIVRNTGNGDGASGLYVAEAMLSLSSTVVTYVETTSASKSNLDGPYWLEFDGTNDYMDLNAVPWQQADDHFISIATRPLQANFNRAFSVGNTASTNAAGPRILTDAVKTLYAAYCDDAATTASLFQTQESLNNNCILTARNNNGTRSTRYNGAPGASSSTVLGTSTLNKVRLGADAYGPGSYWNGRIYNLAFGAGAALVEAQVQAAEYFLSQEAEITF